MIGIGTSQTKTLSMDRKIREHFTTKVLKIVLVESRFPLELIYTNRALPSVCNDSINSLREVTVVEPRLFIRANPKLNFAQVIVDK